jgi:hypothetical protein
MKALKEKRVSLRSLFRRSLVILSLLALVFASCGDSGGGDDGGDGGGTGPVTPPAGPTVLSIAILKQPTGNSFQGCVPNLAGLTVEVVWSDGNRVIETDTSKFFTLPGYCDDPKAVGTGQQMALGYLGQTVISQDLMIPCVVKADALQVTGNAPKDWYSDDRPDFTGLAYEIIVNEGWTGIGATANGKYQKIPQVMSSSYPKVDLTDVVDQAKIGVSIGTGGNVLTTSFKITNYYRVASLAYLSADWLDYFDDGVGKFYSSGAIDEAKVHDEFKKSNVKFTVYYFGGKTRPLTMAEYIANDNWYRTKGLGSGTTPMFTTTIADHQGVGKDGYNVDVLTYDEDEETWYVALNYAPIEFSGNADIANTDVFVPVWIFNEEVTRDRKADAGPSNPTIKGTDGSARAMTDGELDSIKTKWQLQASYGRGRLTKTNPLAVTAQMLYDGYEMFGLASGTSMAFTGTTYNPDGTASGYIGAVASGKIGRNFPLPIYYRNAYISDEDETILVDIQGQ